MAVELVEGQRNNSKIEPSKWLGCIPGQFQAPEFSQPRAFHEALKARELNLPFSFNTASLRIVFWELPSGYLT